MAKTKQEATRTSEQETKDEDHKGKKRKRAGPAPAPADRSGERWPARDRKQVVRFSVPTPRRVSLPKNPKIEEGPGTKLRDIPNVLFKLSKRKADDNLNVLHAIIYGRKSNVHFMKRNILQFSGYVWPANEEKERTKVKEKLDKCTKDKLVEFCQLFDIPLNKAIIRKEEASAKLMEFLEAPYVTRDVVLAEKSQQGKKRKRTGEVEQGTLEGTSSDGGSKRHKGNSGSKVNKGRTHSVEANDDVSDDSEKSKTEEREKKSVPRGNFFEKSRKLVSASKIKKNTSPISKGKTKDTEDKRTKAGPRKKSSEKSEVGASKVKEKPFIMKDTSPESSKSTTKSALKASSAAQITSKTLAKSKNVSFSEPLGEESKAMTKERPAMAKKGPAKYSKKVPKASRKGVSSKNNDSGQPSTSKSKKEDKIQGSSSEKPSPVDKRASKRAATSSSSKTPTKEKGKLKGRKRKAIKGPSRAEMLSVVSDILKDVDFEVATLADILKQLESHFHVDLRTRKNEVKSVIEEAINNMSDDEEDPKDDKAEGEEDKEEDPAEDHDEAEEDHEEDEDLEEGHEENPEEDRDEDKEEEEDTEDGSDGKDSD